MSVTSTTSGSSASWSDTESSERSSVYLTANSDESDTEFRPYEDNVEPLASTEEIVEYEEALAQEEEEENVLQQRFNSDVAVASWCECGNCSLQLMVKPEECRCCMEIEQCRNKMLEYEDGENQKCVLDHPGFNDVCLNEWVLDIASLGLKTKNRRNYASVFREGQKTRSEFLRAVSYRQLVRLIWGFTGSSRHLPLPSCCYNAIRSTFPNSDEREYKGFEEDEDV